MLGAMAASFSDTFAAVAALFLSNDQVAVHATA